jgi:hypothetical protein
MYESTAQLAENEPPAQLAENEPPARKVNRRAKKKSRLFLRLGGRKSRRFLRLHPFSSSRRRTPRPPTTPNCYKGLPTYIHSVLHTGRAKIKSGGRGYKKFWSSTGSTPPETPPGRIPTSSCTQGYISVTVGAVAESPRDMRSPKGNGVPLFTECP